MGPMPIMPGPMPGPIPIMPGPMGGMPGPRMPGMSVLLLGTAGQQGCQARCKQGCIKGDRQGMSKGVSMQECLACQLCCWALQVGKGVRQGVTLGVIKGARKHMSTWVKRQLNCAGFDTAVRPLLGTSKRRWHKLGSASVAQPFRAN